MIKLLDKIILGGVEQWILVRGIDEQKPIILFLHGGPGLPMMPFHQHFQKDIERMYLVVHWDQRVNNKCLGARHFFYKEIYKIETNNTIYCK